MFDGEAHLVKALCALFRFGWLFLYYHMEDVIPEEAVSCF